MNMCKLNEQVIYALIICLQIVMKILNVSEEFRRLIVA